jgi:DNA-binding NtrC family response regulator
MELSVLLVDHDRVWRSMLARDLVRVRWGVSVIDSVEEFDDVVRPGEPIDVAIVDVLHPQASTIVDAVVTAFPTVVLVARASNRATASAMLESKGLHRFDVRAREEPAEELIEAVRRIVEK